MKIIPTIRPLILLSVILLFANCKDDRLGFETSDLPGQKALIHLSFNSPNMEIKSRAALPDSIEREITSLLVYIFNEEKQIVSFTVHEKSGEHTTGSVTGSLDPDYGNQIEIETLTGNNRTIYVVSNYYDNHIEGFKDVATESDLNKLIVQVYGNPILREYGMIKVGKKHLPTVRNNDNIRVELSFVSAKVTINVINKSADFIVDGWSVDGLPTKSYLIKRDQVSNNPNYHDAGDITTPYDYYNAFDKLSIPFETGNGEKDTPHSATFYTLENRRGGRIDKPAPTGDYTGKTHLLKSWYAPANATRLSINGFLAEEKKTVAINYHLGANNHDNYDVERGIHYICTFTINSFNDIAINTNIVASENLLPIRTPPDLMALDAHPSVHTFTLFTNMITDDSKVDIEVIRSTGSTTPPTWMKVSMIPTSTFHVRSTVPDIGQWQQTAADCTYVRPMFIPHRSKRTEQGTAYVHPKNGIQLANDMGNSPNLSHPYPNNDDVLPYSHAAHRMCGKITDLPTYGSTSGALTAPLNIYLYADEYPLEAQTGQMLEPYREAIVRVTLDNRIGEPEYYNFLVRQYSPIRYMDLPERKQTTDSTLYIERSAEYASIVQSSFSMNKQILGGMQWGPYNNGASDFIDGYNNTLLGVYTSRPGSNAAYNASNWQPKYGSLAGGWNSANKGKIAEGISPSANIPTQGTPHFNIPTDDVNFYHSILNTTAARYCHEKNRDENGDGEIDGSETKWYLPSAAEMQLIWTLHEMMDLQSEYYWSSTEANTDSAYAFSMRALVNDSRFVYDGMMQKLPKTHAVGSNPPRVRCVRRDKGAPLLPNVFTNISGSVVLDCSSLPGSVYTSVSKNDIPQNATSRIHAANEKIYRRFEIGAKQHAATDYFSLHAGSGLCNIKEGWRLPTQREMLLIRASQNKFTTPGFEPFVNGKYWTLTRSINKLYTIDFGTGFAEIGEWFKATDQFHYRCIREIP